MFRDLGGWASARLIVLKRLATPARLAVTGRQVFAPPHDRKAAVLTGPHDRPRLAIG